MAPGFYLDVTHHISLENAIPTSSSSTDVTPIRINSGYYWQRSVQVETRPKPETKKQRIARVAKERMLSSWNKHHDKTMTIKKVIQVCKPNHRINHNGSRF